MSENLSNANKIRDFRLPDFDIDALVVRIEQSLKAIIKQEILPNAVYDRDQAVKLTGFSHRTLIRAENRGELAKRYRGRNRYYMGADLLAWLDGKGEIS